MISLTVMGNKRALSPQDASLRKQGGWLICEPGLRGLPRAGHPVCRRVMARLHAGQVPDFVVLHVKEVLRG